MKTYPLFKVHVDVESALRNIKSTLENGYLNEGEDVTRLQAALSPWLGDVTLLNSCTSALTLALDACGVGTNDDVVTTPMTCVATNMPIVTRGANIVWSDIDPNTGMLDPDKLEKSITKRTKAVMYVAWAGNLCYVDHISDVCKRHGIPLILDAAHAFGAKFNGKTPIDAGIADYVCYSLQAIKHITTGDGGAIAVRDNDKKCLIDNLKWFGLNRHSSKNEKGDWKGQQWDVDITRAGYKFNMNNLSAALGLSQLPHIDNILDSHKRNAKLYDRSFMNSYIMPLLRTTHEDSARWVYTVITPFRNHARNNVIEKLNDVGIKAGLVHVSNDDYTCFKPFKKNLPGTREFSERQFSIPCGWWLDNDDIVHIADSVIKLVHENK